MSRPRIAIVLPIRFACRAFLCTPVLEKLSAEAEILLISPYANSDSFQRTFQGEGVRHALLRDFTPVGMHARWHRLLLDATYARPGLAALKCVQALSRYSARERGKRVEGLGYYLKRIAIPRLGGIFPGLRFLTRMERQSYKQMGYSHHEYYLKLLSEFKPDLVVSTSPNRPSEPPIARAVEELGIPHLAYVLSFDNICCYPDFPRLYDYYLVWNDRNRQEVSDRYPSVAPGRIEVCGPLQFDFYATRKRYLTSREVWANSLGSDPRKKFIVFSESGRPVGPHEPELVVDLCQHLSRSPLRESCEIVVRFHPMHPPARWDAVRREFPNVIFQEPTSRRDVETGFTVTDGVTWTDDDFSRLINTLHHGDVHLNVSSTMALDAGYFERPAICLDYDPRPGSPFGKLSAMLYQREHYLDIVASGAVPVTDSSARTLDWVSRFLTDPALLSHERRKMLRVYDPFCDGGASSRVSSAILRRLSSLRDTTDQPAQSLTAAHVA